MTEGFTLTGGGLAYLAEASSKITNKFISITMDKLEKLSIDDEEYVQARRKIVIDALNDIKRELMQEIVGDIEPEINYGRPYLKPEEVAE